MSAWPLAARGAATLIRMSKIRQRCARCGDMIAENAMTRHRQSCRGPAGVPFRIVGHEQCCEGRLKPKLAAHCWACEEKDPVFAVLDDMIAKGISTPRAKLEVTGGR